MLQGLVGLAPADLYNCVILFLPSLSHFYKLLELVFQVLNCAIFCHNRTFTHAISSVWNIFPSPLHRVKFRSSLKFQLETPDGILLLSLGPGQMLLFSEHAVLFFHSTCQSCSFTFEYLVNVRLLLYIIKSMRSRMLFIFVQDCSSIARHCVCHIVLSWSMLKWGRII